MSVDFEVCLRTFVTACCVSCTYGFQVLCWRTVPTDSAGIGDVARNSEPFMRQVFVTGDQDEEILKRQVTGR
jgi:glutamate synthase domain-containing protein 1